MENDRRFRCPFGCASGYKEHELIIHLVKAHNIYAVAQKLVELLKRLRTYELES